MITSLAISAKTKPEEALELPKGRLMIGEYVADFSPENVVAAAKCAIACFSNYNHTHPNFIFVTQASIIEYREKQGPRSYPEYKAF